MRVLQVLPALDSGGVERGTIEIAQALQAAGHSALVASSGGKLTPELWACGARHSELPLASKNPLQIMRNVAPLCELIRREQIDLVHARSRAPAWSAYLAAQRTGIPFVTTFHAAYSLGAPGKRLYNSVMTKGKRVIAISQYIYEHILAHYPVAPERLQLIHRGFDEQRFNPAQVLPAQLQALRQTYGITEHVPVILYPGRITPVKGVDLILKALAQLTELPWQFVIAGGDQGRAHVSSELKALAAQLGLAERVIFTGDLTIDGTVMALGDLIISPRRTPEAFGRTLVEAQAMERLIITSNAGGARETLINGETGWLVEPEDVQGIARAIREFFALGPNERRKREKAARAHVLQHFTTARMCAQTLALYHNVLGR